MSDLQKIQEQLEAKADECVGLNIQNCNLENQVAVLEKQNRQHLDFITRLERENEKYINLDEENKLAIIKLQSENRIIIVIGISAMFILFALGYGIIEGWF